MPVVLGAINFDIQLQGYQVILVVSILSVLIVLILATIVSNFDVKKIIGFILRKKLGIPDRKDGGPKEAPGKKKVNRNYEHTFCSPQKFTGVALSTSLFKDEQHAIKNGKLESQMSHIEKRLEFLRDRASSLYVDVSGIKGDSYTSFNAGMEIAFERARVSLKWFMKENELIKKKSYINDWNVYLSDSIETLFTRMGKIMKIYGFDTVFTGDIKKLLDTEFRDIFETCVEISVAKKNEFNKLSEDYEAFCKDTCGSVPLDFAVKIIGKEVVK